MSPALATRPFRSGVYDFSGGVMGGISDLRLTAKHLRRADNIIFRPLRSISLRQGSRAVTSASLPQTSGPPAVDRKIHSLGRYYGASPKMFGAAWDGTTGFLYEIGASAYTAQTLPSDWSTMSSAEVTFAMVNGNLVATQRGGTAAPMFYHPSNPANTWYTCAYPAPNVASTTLTPSTDGASNLTLLATYYYRLRWKFRDGSSRASSSMTITLTGTDNKVAFAVIPESTRTDYAGWVLERTKANAASTSTYWKVAETFASGTTTYNDTSSDAALWDAIDEGLYYVTPHFDGVMAHRNRMIGWAGSTLYASQVVGDAYASGIFNVHPDSAYVFPTQDNNDIQLCVKQADRIVVLKQASVHALEGDDLLSFRVTDIYFGAGAAGPRAAAASGSDIYIFTPQRGLLLLSGNKVKEQFGWIEVGHYLDEIQSATTAKVVAHNWRNQLLFVAYASGLSTTNDSALVFDLRFRTWTHFTQWRIRDMVDSVDAYLAQTLAFVDHTKGVVWSGFDGTYTDEKNSAGTAGGIAIPFMAETQSIDDGDPTTLKDIQRIALFVRIGTANLTSIVSMDNGRVVTSSQFAVKQTQAKWAPWGGSTPVAQKLKWAPLSSASISAGYTSRFSGRQDAQYISGVELGTLGYAYTMKWTGQLSDALQIGGFGVDGVLLPERRLSWR